MDKVARIIANKDELKEKTEYYTQVIQLLPDEAHGYLNRGFNYFLLGDFKMAEEDFTRVIDLEPDNMVACCLRGFSRDKIEKHKEAMDDFIRALEIDPTFADAYVGMGLMKARRGMYNEAIKYFDQALEIDPNHEKSYAYRGNAYYHSQKYKNAVGDYNKALSLNPSLKDELSEKLGETSFWMGIHYSEKQGEYDKAVEHLNQAIKCIPDRPEIYLYRAEALMELEKIPEAKDDLETIIRIAPDSESGEAAREMLDLIDL